MTDPQAATDKDLPMPRFAAWLGYAGLLPFFGAAIGVHGLPEPHAGEARDILLAYGCVILSFLGGIGWGVALLRAADRDTHLIAGVIPSLLALAAWLLPGASALLMLILGYGAIYLLHRDMAAALALPPWFQRLRLHLSIGAGISLIIGLA